MSFPVQVLVKYCDPSSGGEGVAYRFCRYMQARGVPFVMVCGRNKEPNGPLAEHVVTLGMLRPTRLLKYASFFHRAERYIAEHKGLSFSFEYIPGSAIVRQTGVHRTFLARSLEGLNEKDTRRKVRNRVLNPYNKYLPMQERRTLFSSALRQIVVPSAMTRAEVRAAYPTLCDKVAVIPNGVDTQRFCSVDAFDRDAARQHFWPQAVDKRIVGFAGNGFLRKGLAHCIGSLPLLPDDIVLLVAGGDSPELYERQACELGVGHRIRWLGEISDMPRFFHALDAFCLPTRYDPFGLVIAEALASGVPVVTSTQAGSAQVVCPDVSGVVCSQLDDATVACAVERVLQLPRGHIASTVGDERDMFAAYLALTESVRGG